MASLPLILTHKNYTKTTSCKDTAIVMSLKMEVNLKWGKHAHS
jgi:hypothetical protein